MIFGWFPDFSIAPTARRNRSATLFDPDPRSCPVGSHFGCPDCPKDPPKVHLEAQSAPACRLGPSKVLLSLQRGTKITKSDFSDISDKKVGPGTLKCLQSGLQTRPRASKGLPSVPKWVPSGPQRSLRASVLIHLGYVFGLLGHFSYVRSPSSSKVTSKSQISSKCL